MENRIEILRNHIDNVLSNMPDTFDRRCAYLHLYGVSQACALIALKRGENVELATMAGMLHDFYTYKFGDAKNHAEKGAILAREVLKELKITSDNETDMICSAIRNHSSKSSRFSAFDEVLIDADVMQHCLYNITKPVMEHEAERFNNIISEFGLNRINIDVKRDVSDIMNIMYQMFDDSHLHGVLILQTEWFNENITFGIVPETAEEIAGYKNDYFYVAICNGDVIGYITAEIVDGNEYNVFPKGTSYLRINDLYVAQKYRNNGIGEGLLSLVEQKAYKNGLQHILISSATKDAAAVRNFYTRNGYDVWTTMFYKRKDWDVRTYPFNELDGYRYVVIFAHYQNKWLYCRAKERDTFETAGGHIEQGETPIDAAKRELYEETGAVKFDIAPAFDYSVHTPTDFSNGQVFIAQINELGDIPDYEMAEVRLFDTIPNKMRFPQILPILFEKVKDMI